MAKVKQISNAKPKVDKTRKTRADRRKAFLDAAAKRMGMLDWGSFEKWARECAEEPFTDQGVNNRLRLMLTAIFSNIPGGDPGIPPADMDEIRRLYPVKGHAETAENVEPKFSEKTRARIQAGIEKFNTQDEAGRLAVRPKPPLAGD